MLRKSEDKMYQAYRLVQVAPCKSRKASKRDEAEEDELDEVVTACIAPSGGVAVAALQLHPSPAL